MMIVAQSETIPKPIELYFKWVNFKVCKLHLIKAVNDSIICVFYKSLYSIISLLLIYFMLINIFLQHLKNLYSLLITEVMHVHWEKNLKEYRNVKHRKSNFSHSLIISLEFY